MWLTAKCVRPVPERRAGNRVRPLTVASTLSAASIKLRMSRGLGNGPGGLLGGPKVRPALLISLIMRWITATLGASNVRNFKDWMRKRGSF